MKQNKNILAVIFIALITLLFFGVCIKGNINIDDELIFNSLSANPKVSDIASVFKQRYNGSDYRPIVVLTFVIEQLVFGHIDLSISHGINVFLYYLLGVTVFFFIKNIPIHDKLDKDYFALLSSILFIVHPIHSSVVSSLKSRDNLLSMLFGILGLYLFTIITKSKGLKRAGLILLMLLSLLVSLLSKLDAFGILVSISLYLFIFHVRKWKTIALSLLIPIVIFSVWNSLFHSTEITKEISTVTVDENQLVAYPTFINKISCVATSLYYYTKFMLIPKGYYFYFGYKQIILYKIYHPLVMLSILFHLLLLLYAFFTFRKHRIIAFAVLFYFLTLAYCLNFFTEVAGVVADRYAFIASLGFSVLVGYLILLFLNEENKFSNFLRKKSYRKWLIIVFILLFYFPFTYQRNKDWKDKITLIEKDIPHLQQSFHALRIASSVYQDMSKSALSKKESIMYLHKSNDACKKAISVYDLNLVVWTRLAQNEYILGNKAIAYNTLKNAIKTNDTISGLYSMVANFYYKDGKNDSAILYLEKAISLDRLDGKNYVTITDLLNKNGEFRKAIELNNTLKKLNPNTFESYQNLANTALYKKDTLLATEYFLNAFKNGMINNELAKGIQEYLNNNNRIEKATEYDQYLNAIDINQPKYVP